MIPLFVIVTIWGVGKAYFKNYTNQREHDFERMQRLERNAANLRQELNKHKLKSYYDPYAEEASQKILLELEKRLSKTDNQDLLSEKELKKLDELRNLENKTSNEDVGKDKSAERLKQLLDLNKEINRKNGN